MAADRGAVVLPGTLLSLPWNAKHLSDSDLGKLGEPSPAPCPTMTASHWAEDSLEASLQLAWAQMLFSALSFLVPHLHETRQSSHTPFI